MPDLPWIDFDGDYEKIEYDIMLTDGTVVNNCWPNAGGFFPLLSSEAPKQGKEVIKIRPAMVPMMGD